MAYRPWRDRFARMEGGALPDEKSFLGPDEGGRSGEGFCFLAPPPRAWRYVFLLERSY